MKKILYAVAITVFFAACGSKKSPKDGEVQMEVNDQDEYRSSFEKEMSKAMQKMGATNFKVEDFKVVLKKNVTDTKIPLAFNALEAGDSTIQVVKIASKISFHDPKTNRDTSNTDTFDAYYNMKNQLILPNPNQISLALLKKLSIK